MIKVYSKNTTTLYGSLDEFVENFPFAERQCKFQIECELKRKGFVKITDYHSPEEFILTSTDEI